MRSIKSIAASLIALVAVIAVAHTLANADDPAPDAANVTKRVYVLKDLPVWSADGKTFNSNLVEYFIKTSVDSKTWQGTSSMVAYSQNSSLVVSTTAKNHDAIGELLEQLRRTGIKVAGQ